MRIDNSNAAAMASARDKLTFKRRHDNSKALQTAP
jgi:hypothetical protein